MTLEIPNWLQNGSFAARLDRGVIAQMWDEGILDQGLKVTQNGGGAMNVNVAAGTAIVQGDDQAEQGNYRCRNTATFNLTGFVAASSTQRIDGVDLRVNDPNAGGPAGDNFTIVRTAGTESGSPVAPAIPASAIRLATIGPFTTSTSSIITSMITDLRAPAGDRSSIGTLRALAGGNPAVPNGWLACGGQAVSRTTYARLFDLLGTAYGVGDGSSTFNVPDLRGRTLVGFDNMGFFGAAGRIPSLFNPGQTGGSQTHTLLAGELPPLTAPDNGLLTTNPAGVFYANAGTGGVPLYARAAVVGSGTSTPFDITQPYAGVLYVIRT